MRQEQNTNVIGVPRGTIVITSNRFEEEKNKNIIGSKEINRTKKESPTFKSRLQISK